MTAATLDPGAPNGAAGWYKSPVNVTLATKAGATSEYRIGDGPWLAYLGPFSLSDGEHTVRYRSKDALGNAELEQSLSAKVDATKPTSNAAVHNGVVTLTGADAGSGLARVEYRLDGGDWITYTGPVTLTKPGTLEHRATDVHALDHESLNGIPT